MAIVSTAAPANPTIGMEWWNNTILQVYDGSAWKTIGPGGVTGPVPTTTKAFSINQPTDVSLGAATWAVVPFTATPSLDTYSGWNATTKVFKPTRAGIYQFLIRGYMTAPAGGWCATNLLKNDQGTYNPGNLEQIAEDQIFAAGVSSVILTAAGMSQMNGSTDFVRLWAYATDGNYRTFTNPNFEAYLMP